MNISTKSQFFRFLDRNIISRTWSIPWNLCPFMRLIICSIVLNLFLGVLTGLALFGLVLTPMFFFDNLEFTGFWMGLSILLGGVTYIGSFTFGLVWLLLEYGGRPAEAIGGAVKNTINYITAMESIGIIRAWFKAMHDKTCPHINFTS